MMFGFMSSRPLHLVPLFILFPLCTHLFPFLSCPPVFMSGHLILSFVCTHMGPGLSVYARNLLQPRFQVAQIFIMRRVSLVVPVHLVPFLRNHTHLCPVWSPFSCLHSFVLLRAHLHFALTLGVCVCV